MNFYISQLDENKKIIPIIEKYNVGLEIVQFSNPFTTIPIIAGNEYFSRSLPIGSVPKIS